MSTCRTSSCGGACFISRGDGRHGELDGTLPVLRVHAVPERANRPGYRAGGSRPSVRATARRSCPASPHCGQRARRRRASSGMSAPYRKIRISRSSTVARPQAGECAVTMNPHDQRASLASAQYTGYDTVRKSGGIVMVSCAGFPSAITSARMCSLGRDGLAYRLTAATGGATLPAVASTAGSCSRPPRGGGSRQVPGDRDDIGFVAALREDLGA